MELARTAETSDNFVNKRARAMSWDSHLALVLSRRATKRAKAHTFSLRISRGTLEMVNLFSFLRLRGSFRSLPAHPRAHPPRDAARGVANRLRPLASLTALTRIYSGEVIARR